MIRRFLASTLCLVLAPLLVAQQTPQPAPDQNAPAHININLAGITGLRFISPQPESLASIRTGDLVQFTVATDITSGDAVLLHAGVPVAGVVAQVKHSSRFHHRDGQITIQVTEVIAGKTTDVLVRCDNPADRLVASTSPNRPVNIGHAAFAIAGAVLGFLVIYGATHHTDG